MACSEKIPLILGCGGHTQWQALGSDWAAFVSFWSETNEDNDLRNQSYPYVLDLRLSDDIKKLIVPLTDLSTKILVTQSYADLYNRIKLGFRLDDGVQNNGIEITRPSVPLRDGVLITGQPGTGMLTTCQLTSTHHQTGKSVSLWYIAIRLLQDYPLEPLLIIQPNMVLLLYRRNAYILLGSKMLKSPMQLPTDIFSFYQGYPSCIALIEWNTTSALCEPLEWGCLLTIFAACRDSLETPRFVDSRFPAIWGMPTWNRLELRKG